MTGDTFSNTSSNPEDVTSLGETPDALLWVKPPSGLLDSIMAEVEASPSQEPAPRHKTVWLSGLATVAAMLLLLVWPSNPPQIMANAGSNSFPSTLAAAAQAPIPNDELAMLSMESLAYVDSGADMDPITILVGF